MATSLREVFITFTLIGIIAFGLFSFGVSVQEENEVDDTILGNPLINSTFNRLESNLSAMRDDTQGQRENFEGEVPERGFGTLLIFSIVTVGQKFVETIVSISNIMIVLPAQIIGVPKAVISAIWGILIVTLVLLTWSLIRQGR